MADDFDPVRLPSGINIKMRGGPTFKTAVTIGESGFDWRNSDWDYPIWKYVVRYVRKREGFDPFVAFFLGRRGRGKGFLFKDWADYTVTPSQGVIVLIDGLYRLCKRYDFEGYTFDRVISRPIVDTLDLPDGASLSEDYDYAVVEGVTGGTWSGEFDVPVRFDTDEMEFESDPSGVREWVDVLLVEIRE